MKKLILFTLSLLLLSSFTAWCQEIQPVRSVKLLQDNGIEELYEVHKTQGGYLCLGMKGTEARDKRLWMLHLDEQMNVQRSQLISGEALSNPCKVLQLPDGQHLVLAQQELGEQRSSFLFCIGVNGNLAWSRNFNSGNRTAFPDICLSGNKILLAGREYRSGSLAKEREALLLMQCDLRGNIEWQYKYDLGHCEVDVKDIFTDAKGNILVNGTLTEASKKSEYDKMWFAFKTDPGGQVVNRLQVSAYAHYNYAATMTPYKDGYIAILNHKNYFGKPIVLELDQNLSILKSYTFDGTALMLSGIALSGNNIIFGAVFSNTVKDYAPGYITYTPGNNQVSAKASPTLFQHFFITNMLSLEDERFMLSGIGYHEKNGSDVYFLPFTREGNSSCELKEYTVKKRNQNVDIATPSAVTKTISDVRVTSSRLDLVETAYSISDICTAPDEFVVNPSKNKNWKQWKKNNESTFAVKVPEDWIEIWPNPATDRVTVTYRGMRKTDELKLMIRNALGKDIFKKTYTNQDFFDVDVSGFVPGVYMFFIDDGKETRLRKVVIAR